MKDDQGMTLLDSLMAMAMAVLMLSLGVPAMQDFLRNRRMDAWLGGLHTVLNHARQQAVIHQHAVVVCASTTGDRCDAGVEWNRGVMVFLDRNHDRQRQLDERVLHYWHMDDAGLQVHTSSGRKTLRFLPNGTSPGSNARISLCDDRGPASARALVLANTGRVRQERADRGVRIRCR